MPIVADTYLQANLSKVGEAKVEGRIYRAMTGKEVKRYGTPITVNAIHSGAYSTAPELAAKSAKVDKTPADNELCTDSTAVTTQQYADNRARMATASQHGCYDIQSSNGSKEYCATCYTLHHTAANCRVDVIKNADRVKRNYE
eukprot:IDg3647t1